MTRALAYAKRLLAKRRGADPPWSAILCLGRDWRGADVALSYDDARPGVFDLRLLAGLSVEARVERWPWDLDGDLGFFLDLNTWCAELHFECRGETLWHGLSSLAWDAKRGAAWPAWWNGEVEQDTYAKAHQWSAAYTAYALHRLDTRRGARFGPGGRVGTPAPTRRAGARGALAQQRGDDSATR